MSHELKWEDEGYYLHMWGTVTTDDMDDALAKIWGNTRSDSMKYCIRDYLDVTKVDIDMSMDEVSLYVSTYEKSATNSSHNPLKLVAFLSQNEEMNHIIEGYSQLMKKHNPDAIFKNFENVKDARVWVSSSL